MGDTYKGESPAKKLARLLFWRNVARDHGEAAFVRGHHFFLASREGGDASVLTGMGVPHSRMVAIERDASAAAKFQERWPNITLVIGDAADVIEMDTMQQWGISTVFLDFCAPLCAETFNTVRRIVNATSPGTTVAYALLRGREGNKEGIDPMSGLSRKERRLWASITRRAVKKRTEGYGPVMREVFKGRALSGRVAIAEGGDPGDVDARRISAIHLLLSANPKNQPVQLVRSYNYQSTTESSNGVPMTIGQMMRRKALSGASFEAVRIPAIDEEALRKMALAHGENAGLLFNVPPATISAWKAHATRGTYEHSGVA